MDRPFLGRGIIRPFRRDLKSDIASASDLALVQSCIGQVLGTMANDGDRVQGELPWRPEFGSRVYKLKHRKGALLDAMAKAFIADALAQWEPRVILKATKATFDAASRTLTVRITYDIIDRNVPGNQVLYGDIEQTITLPTAA